MSWLNAEAARLLALKTFNPPHTHTLTHRLAHTANYPGTHTNGPKTAWAWQKKGKNGVEHATLIFIDFILTPKRQTHQGWSPSPDRPSVRPFAATPPRLPVVLATFPWQAHCWHAYIKLARRQASQQKKGFIMAICLNSCAYPWSGEGRRGRKGEQRGGACGSSKFVSFFSVSLSL